MIAATDAGAKAGDLRVMSARDLGAETTDDLSTSRDVPERTAPADVVTDAPASAESSVQEIGQQPLALNAPSLNTIIEQAVGNMPAMTTSTGLGIPEFLTPGISSISGIFGGIALGGLAAGGGGGSAGLFSVAGASTSVLGGRLVNGYISGARVYQDQDNDGVFDGTDANDDGYADEDSNKNWIVDAGEEYFEPFYITDGDGSYSLTIIDGGGSLIAEPLSGTIDQSMSLDGDPVNITSTFRAPSGATVISPVSTLVEAGLSESQVKTALGIDSSIDILEFDPVYETLYGDDPDKALGFKSASVLVSNLMDVGSEVIGGAAGSTDNFSDQVVTGIVGLIRESGSSTLDLADSDTIGSALTKAATAAQISGVAIDPTASSFIDTVTGMKTQIATANAAVKAALIDNPDNPAAALEQIAKVEKVAQKSLAAKARAVADGTDDGSVLDLSTEINNATVPDVIRPLVPSTTPVRGSTGVISLYSDAYDDTVTPSWTVSGSGTITDTEITSGSGDTSKKITDLDGVTMTLPGTVDGSEMRFLHLSIWRSKPSADLTVKVVDYGSDGIAGGDNNPFHELTYNATNGNEIEGGQWVDLSIDLSSLSGLSSTANIGEIVITSRKDGVASGEVLYIDNVYLSKVFDGLTFDEPTLQFEAPEPAYIPERSYIAQSDGNNLLGIGKTHWLSHAVLGTGTVTGDGGDRLLIIDPVDLNTNPVLGMWAHTEAAGSEIRIQLGDSASGGWPNDQKYTEAVATTTKAGWNFLTFDFDNPADRFVADGATDGSRGYTLPIRFDPDTTYDMLAIFPDLTSRDAIGNFYYFDDLAPYTGTRPPEPLPIEDAGDSDLPDFPGLDFEGGEGYHNLIGFEGAEDSVSLIPEPGNESNTVVSFTKTLDAYYYAGVRLGIGESESVGKIGIDLTNNKTAIAARIKVPEGYLDASGGPIIARMEIGDTIFGGAIDSSFVHAEAELTETGWNEVLFDFSDPVERYVSSLGTEQTVSLSGTVDYDRIAVFVDWEHGKGLGATPLKDPVTFYIDDITVPGTGSGNYTVPDGYVLKFEDNFDNIGQAPDAAHWTLETGNGQTLNEDTGELEGNAGWGNNELQVYEDDLDDVQIVDMGVADGDTDRSDDGINGALRITAKRDGDGITSARVKSDIDDLPAYGYYEIRAKLPSKSGAWPAIWLLGDLENNTWPQTGEIDMVEWSSEYFSEADGDAIIHALHFAGNEDQPQSYGDTQFKWEGQISSQVDDWHTYQLWWTPDSIKLGVDGTNVSANYAYYKPFGAGDDAWPFDEPMDIIMNVAMGGTLGGDQNVPGGDFSYDMYVDYVRVYQTPAVPTARPGLPGINASVEENVVALLGDAFHPSVVTVPSDWRAEGSINSTEQDIDLGDESTVKRYSDVTEFVIEPSATLDVSGAYTFQFSIFRTDPYADLKVRLVDLGADGDTGGGNDSSHEVVFSHENGNAVASGEWVNLEILMPDLTGLDGQSSIGQIVISSHHAGTTDGSGETIYLDDMFFSPAPVPVTGPAAPDEPARFVQSLYSSFDDAVSSTFTDGSGAAQNFTIAGGAVKKAGGGLLTVTPEAPLDLSLAQTLQFDVWRTDATAELRLTMTDTDDGERTIVLSEANGYPAPVVGEWTHFDVAMADLSSSGSVSAIDQIKLSSHSGSEGSGETIYVDNLFASTPPPALEILFEPDDGSGWGFENVVGGDAYVQDVLQFIPPGGDGAAGELVKGAGEDIVGAAFLTLESGGLVSEDNSKISMRVWTQDNDVPVTLKLEDVSEGSGATVEQTVLTGSGKAGEWQTISWDFSPVANHSHVYDRVSVFFDAVNKSSTEYYNVDDVQFYGATGQ